MAHIEHKHSRKAGLSLETNRLLGAALAEPAFRAKLLGPERADALHDYNMPADERAAILASKATTLHGQLARRTMWQGATITQTVAYLGLLYEVNTTTGVTTSYYSLGGWQFPTALGKCGPPPPEPHDWLFAGGIPLPGD